MDNETKKKTTTKKTSTSKKSNGTKTKTNSTGTKKTTTKTATKANIKTSAKTTKPVEEKVIIKEETKNEEIKNEVPKKEVLKNEFVIDNKMIAIIVLALLIASIGIAKISGVLDDKDYSQSYLLKHKIVTNKIEDVDINNISLNKDVFILVTSLKNEEEYNLEKNLKKVIKDNGIKDNFYVYIYDDENTDLNKVFNISGDIKVPTILYYKNGEFVDMVKREDQQMIEAADFAKLLDIYELSKEED